VVREGQVCCSSTGKAAGAGGVTVVVTLCKSVSEKPGMASKAKQQGACSYILRGVYPVALRQL
jgi:hypothetical protein